MAQNNRIVKLKLDIIFKAMFGRKENEKLLADFLSRLLEIPRASIQHIIMDNVELMPDNYADKFSRVDLRQHRIIIDYSNRQTKNTHQNAECIEKHSIFHRKGALN